MMTTELPQRARIFVRPAWGGDAGISRILVIALPLIASNAVHSLNMFIDRTLLAQYDANAFAAALQGGFMSWAVMSLFMQTVAYTSTFIAQYTGAKADHNVGPALWHGIWLALAGGLILALAIAPLGLPFFQWIGHEGPLPALEAEYFSIITIGSVFLLLNVALSGFYSGRGNTKFVLLVNFIVFVINVGLNFWFIFTPPWPIGPGIAGAAWATVVATAIGDLIFIAAILFPRSNEQQFRVRSAWRPQWPFFRRVLRFGLPAGIHHTIDMVAFGTFIMVVGIFSWEAQHASNMAMNLNFLFFIPAVGFGQGVSILSGQYAGARDFRKTEQMAAGSAVLMLIYMAAVCFIYIGIPEATLNWFRGDIPTKEWEQLIDLAKTLLIFVAIYSTFDALLLNYSGALRGAGDTKFVMWMAIIFSQTLLTLPCVLIAVFRDRFEDPLHGLYLSWFFCSFYITFLGVMYFARYVNGAWKQIDMIGD